MKHLKDNELLIKLHEEYFQWKHNLDDVLYFYDAKFDMYAQGYKNSIDVWIFRVHLFDYDKFDEVILVLDSSSRDNIDIGCLIKEKISLGEFKKRIFDTGYHIMVQSKSIKNPALK